jgi:tetratricopeptide (TPR) repeat protein
VSASASNLALIYNFEGKYSEAEPLYKQAIQIREKNLGPEDPGVVQTQEIYAAMLRQEGRKDEARKIESETQKIQTDTTQKAAPRL